MKNKNKFQTEKNFLNEKWWAPQIYIYNEILTYINDYEWKFDDELEHSYRH